MFLFVSWYLYIGLVRFFFFYREYHDMTDWRHDVEEKAGEVIWHSLFSRPSSRLFCSLCWPTALAFTLNYFYLGSAPLDECMRHTQIVAVNP